MTQRLSNNIIATLTYFDVFDFPMTGYEMYAYLIDSEKLLGGESVSKDEISMYSVVSMLDQLVQDREVGCKHGYYYLFGREALSAQRRARSKVSEQKLKKMKRLFWIFRYIPFVRMVGVTGTLSMKNIDSESDWDVFVVLKSGNIWTGRTVVTTILQILGKRRHGDLEKDRVCLNYYVTETSLEISIKDLFAAREYAFMTPLVGGVVFSKFEAKNSWINRSMPNWIGTYEPPLLLIPDTKYSLAIRSFFEKILTWNFLEDRLRKWQKEKIQKNPKTRIVGGYIQADDDGLIFLPKPQGPITFEKFKKKMKEREA